MRLSTYTDTEQLDKSSLLNSSKMGGGTAKFLLKTRVQGDNMRPLTPPVLQ